MNYIKPNTITEDLLSYDLRTRIKRLEGAAEYITVNSNTVTEHKDTLNRNLANSHPASAISLDTTNFDNNLTPSDDTVQKAIETLDDLVSSGGGESLEIVEITRFVDYESSFRYDSANKDFVIIKQTDEDTNYKIFLESNISLKIGKKVFIFWEGASEDAVYLDVAKKNISDVWEVEQIAKKCVKGYVWTGTIWIGLDNRLIDFGGVGSYDFSSTALALGLNSIAIGNNANSNTGIAIGSNTFTSNVAIAIGLYAYATSGISIGNNALTNNDSVAIGISANAAHESSIAIGKYNFASKKYAKAIGGYGSQADRIGEESMNVSEDYANIHKTSTITWSGFIDTIIGWWEIYLYGLTNQRFEVKDNSLINGVLYISGARTAGGTQIFSGVFHIAIYKGTDNSSIVLRREQVIDVLNDDPGIMDVDFSVDTTDGTFRVYIQSGSAVRAYNSKWTATFRYNETIFL